MKFLEDENEKPWHDPIVAEVREIREALFAEAGHDIHEFGRRLMARQATAANLVKAPAKGKPGEAA